MFRAKDDNIGLDATLLQCFYRVLCRFSLQLMSRRQKRNIREVNRQTISPQFPLHLSHSFNEWQRLDVSDRSSNLCNHKVKRPTFSQSNYIMLNLIGNMRDYLNGFSKEIPPTLFLNNRMIDTSGSQVVNLVCLNIQESLIMPQIKVSLMPVRGNITLTVFIGIKCTRIHIDIRIQFLIRYPQPACLQ